MNYISQLRELALGSRLKQLSDIIMADGKRIYLDSGIDFDPTWFPVYKLISEKGPLGVVEIADDLRVSHPHIIKVIRALEKKKLVVNTLNESDARKRSIKLSEEGEQLLPELTLLWADIDKAIKNLLAECRNNLIMALMEVENGLINKGLYHRFEEEQRTRMMNEVEIISYSKSLAPSFKVLNMEWLEKYFSVEPIDHEILNNPYDKIIKPGGEVLFAVFQGEIVGTCALIDKENGRYELSKMAVTEKAQGLQIGKKLGLAIIDRARNMNAKVLFLESNSRLKPALSLYRKLGFVEMPRPDEMSSEYLRSDVYMELVY